MSACRTGGCGRHTTSSASEPRRDRGSGARARRRLQGPRLGASGPVPRVQAGSRQIQARGQLKCTAPHRPWPGHGAHSNTCPLPAPPCRHVHSEVGKSDAALNEHKLWHGTPSRDNIYFIISDGFKVGPGPRRQRAAALSDRALQGWGPAPGRSCGRIRAHVKPDLPRPCLPTSPRSNTLTRRARWARAPTLQVGRQASARWESCLQSRW